MVLALTWWGWSGLIVVLVLMLGVWARRAWRTTARLALVEHLRRELPELQITRVHANHLVFTVPGAAGGEGTFYLQRFYGVLAASEQSVGRGRGGPPRSLQDGHADPARDRARFGARPGA